MKHKNQVYGGLIHLHCMKQKLRNVKLNSHGSIRLAVFFATAFAVFMLTACSGGSGTKSFHYLVFLQKYAKQGIHSKEDLLAFIKDEHLHFKSFLQYLSEFADDDIGDIRRTTEQCCREILHAADRKELSHKDAMIYLSMRTNLRLLRNAQVAIKDLKSGRVKDEHTMHAYLLMMMLLFMSMDDLSVSVLSDKDKADLYKISDTLPKEMDNLAKKMRLDKQRLSDMPMLMMKIYGSPVKRP